MQDTKYLVMKTSRRATVINNYFVRRAAKQLPISTLMFLLENHADQVHREYQSRSTVFQFTGTAYPVRIWFNTNDHTWDVSVSFVRKTHYFAEGADGLGMSAAAEYVMRWQTTGVQKKREVAKEVQP